MRRSQRPAHLPTDNAASPRPAKQRRRGPHVPAAAVTTRAPTPARGRTWEAAASAGVAAAVHELSNSNSQPATHAAAASQSALNAQNRRIQQHFLGSFVPWAGGQPYQPPVPHVGEPLCRPPFLQAAASGYDVPLAPTGTPLPQPGAEFVNPALAAAALGAAAQNASWQQLLMERQYQQAMVQGANALPAWGLFPAYPWAPSQLSQGAGMGGVFPRLQQGMGQLGVPGAARYQRLVGAAPTGGRPSAAAYTPSGHTPAAAPPILGGASTTAAPAAVPQWRLQPVPLPQEPRSDGDGGRRGDTLATESTGTPSTQPPSSDGHVPHDEPDDPPEAKSGASASGEAESGSGQTSHRRHRALSRSSRSFHKPDYIGITRTRHGRWQAQIHVGGPAMYLGTFLTAREAAIEYDVNAVKYKGEGAARNFPGQDPVKLRDELRSSRNEVDSYKGVSQTGARWRAKIYHKGKSIHLGHFSTAKEAALAYDEKARELRGTGTRTNFPPPETFVPPQVRAPRKRGGSGSRARRPRSAGDGACSTRVRPATGAEAESGTARQADVDGARDATRPKRTEHVGAKSSSNGSPGAGRDDTGHPTSDSAESDDDSHS